MLNSEFRCTWEYVTGRSTCNILLIVVFQYIVHHPVAMGPMTILEVIVRNTFNLSLTRVDSTNTFFLY